MSNFPAVPHPVRVKREDKENHDKNHKELDITDADLDYLPDNEHDADGVAHHRWVHGYKYNLDDTDSPV